jgi:hypothetical protein
MPPGGFSSTADTPLNLAPASNTPKPPPAAPSAQEELLKSIRSFQGFQNKVEQRPVERKQTDPSPVDEKQSIVDQLRNELLKRAQYLNDSSDDQGESDSEWQ